MPARGKKGKPAKKAAPKPAASKAAPKKPAAPPPAAKKPAPIADEPRAGRGGEEE